MNYLDPSDDAAKWTGFTTFAALVEQAKVREAGNRMFLELEFASLTTFNWMHMPNKIYGNHSARLPLSHYVFPGLAKRWQELAPPELAHVVQRERIAAYIEATGVVIEDYNLQISYLNALEYCPRRFYYECVLHEFIENAVWRSPFETGGTEEVLREI